MEDKNKRTFKEMWNDKRMHALIVLGMWFVFFTFTFLILGIASLFNSKEYNNKKINVETETVDANILEMLENLISSDYSYEFKITNEENSYSYTGTKENEENKGYYENATGIIKYSVVDGKYYQLEGDNILENPNIVTIQDQELMELSKILEKVKEYENNSEVINENNKYTYEVLLNDILCVIDIYTNANDISEISISYNNFYYNLKFKNIIKES